MNPHEAMRRALAAARRAQGRVAPNPPVGAALFRGATLLATGATAPPGGAHAEIAALKRARKLHGAPALRGAQLAVTLEPCAHQGRTAPCTDALAAAGVSQVWVGHSDPHPLVKGRGLRALRRHGIQVQTGILEAECREQHRGFLSVLQRGRPWLALKLAATLDGRIATAAGEARWITSAAARAHAHRFRARHDAILIGAQSAKLDNPALTARTAQGRVLRRPRRILIDGGLRVSAAAKLYRDEGAANTLCLTRGGHSARALALRAQQGARVIPVAARAGHVHLPAALQRLARCGITSVLAEGGGLLAAALLRAGLVDEIHWYAAPALLGADARPAIGKTGFAKLVQMARFKVTARKTLGEDSYLNLRPQKAPAPQAAAKLARPPASRRRRA